MAGAFPTPGTWATTEDLPPAATTELQASVGPDTIALGLSVASTVLYNLTDQRWPGPIERTIFPCLCRCRARTDVDCCCEPHSVVELGYPVTAASVTIAGEVIAADLYELQDERRLVWIGGPDSDRTAWPSVQDLDAAPGQEGTWSVTFTERRAVPDEARAMAGRLGWELALLMSPSASSACRLSPRTIAATRRGATQQQIDPAKLIELGATSLPEVDLWLRALSRGRSRRGARIWRPGGGPRPGHTRG